jgi:hypothetical protein
MNLGVSSHLHGHTVVKDHATFAAQPPHFRAVSSERVAHTRMEPTAYTRREQRCLAVVPPSAFHRALPLTARGSCSGR